MDDGNNVHFTSVQKLTRYIYCDLKSLYAYLFTQEKKPQKSNFQCRNT